jgi:hypothetical protein
MTHPSELKLKLDAADKRIAVLERKIEKMRRNTNAELNNIGKAVASLVKTTWTEADVARD